jgi:uncharacterized protein (DUF697 family)
MAKYVMLFVAVGVVLFIILLAAAVWAAIYGKRYAYRFLKPNPRDVQNDLERLRRKYPNSSADEIASKYVGSQAVFLGMVGLLTEVWGFIIPVLGFTIDASFTTLRQMRMAHVVTALYGGDDTTDPEEMEMRFMAMAGLGSLVPRLLFKVVLGEIPIFGGVVNFAINWGVTRSIGAAAITWGRGRTIRDAAAGAWNNRAHVGEVAAEKIGQAKRAAARAALTARQAAGLNPQTPSPEPAKPSGLVVNGRPAVSTAPPSPGGLHL